MTKLPRASSLDRISVMLKAGLLVLCVTVVSNSIALAEDADAASRCGVDCVFLVEQHFFVGNGDYSQLLKELQPIGPNGLDLESMKSHLVSRGLHAVNVETTPHKLLEWSREQKQELAVIAHLIKGHYVLLHSVESQDAFRVKDASRLVEASVKGDEFSGYFCVSSNRAIRLPGGNSYRLLTTVSVIGLLVAITIVLWRNKHRRIAGTRMGLLLTGFGFSIALGCSNEKLEKAPSGLSDQSPPVGFQVFESPVIHLGEMPQSTEIQSRKIEIEIPNNPQPDEIFVKTSCNCVIPRLSWLPDDKKWELTMFLTAKELGESSAQIEVTNTRENLSDSVVVRFNIVGTHSFEPRSIDFGEVERGKVYAKENSLSLHDSEISTAVSDLRLTVLGGSNAIRITPIGNQYRLELKADGDAPAGVHLATIQAYLDDQLICSGSVFWRTTEQLDLSRNPK